MCTRYYIEHEHAVMLPISKAAAKSPLCALFRDRGLGELVTSGEIHPTEIVPVLAPNRDGRMSAYPMKWGFFSPNRPPLLNARVETAAVKPTFSEAWQNRRCIIPAARYFEWEHIKNAAGQTKTGSKYAISSYDNSLIWLCGLYRIDEGLPYFVVLTREPGAKLQQIHDRMPVILPQHLAAEWLRLGANPEELLRCAVTDLSMKPA